MLRHHWSLAFLLVFLSPLAANAQPSPELERQVLEIIKRNPQVILDTVSNYQEQTARAQRLAEWQRYIDKPVKVDIRNAPKLGAADAPLTLVEFSDFQCPFCIRVEPTLKALLAKYKGQLRLAYLHLPLPSHAYEQIAEDLKLNLAKFNKDRQSSQGLAQVAADQQQAEKLGIEGTPSFVLNGVLLLRTLKRRSS